MSKVQIENSVTKLSSSIQSGEDEKRDIAKLALKTVVSKIPADMAAGPIKKCLEPLLAAVADERVETKQDSLEVLADILSRFGSILTASHEQMQQAFVKELSSKRPAVRKRAIMCLAALSVNTSDKLFNDLVTAVLDGIKKSQAGGGDDLRTFINASSAISKTAGYRFGKYLDRFVPLLLKVADSISEEEGEDEVREYIMQAFESFIIRCPDEIKKFIELIIILCKEYLEVRRVLLAPPTCQSEKFFFVFCFCFFFWAQRPNFFCTRASILACGRIRSHRLFLHSLDFQIVHRFARSNYTMHAYYAPLHWII